MNAIFPRSPRRRAFSSRICRSQQPKEVERRMILDERAPSRQAGGHWFEPSSPCPEAPRKRGCRANPRSSGVCRLGGRCWTGARRPGSGGVVSPRLRTQSAAARAGGRATRQAPALAGAPEVEVPPVPFQPAAVGPRLLVRGEDRPQAAVRHSAASSCAIHTQTSLPSRPRAASTHERKLPSILRQPCRRASAQGLDSGRGVAPEAAPTR